MNLPPVSAETLQLAINLFLTVGSVSLLLSLLNSVLSVVAFFKRPRTIESMFYDIDARWRDEQKELADAFDVKLEKLAIALSEQINNRALHRDVTAMETRISVQVESLKRDLGERMSGLHSAVVAQRQTFEALSTDINRTVGEIIGQIKPKGGPHAG